MATATPGTPKLMDVARAMRSERARPVDDDVGVEGDVEGTMYAWVGFTDTARN
jgi:hypothetical protein